jgi:hypothetical protein
MNYTSKYAYLNDEIRELKFEGNSSTTIAKTLIKKYDLDCNTNALRFYIYTLLGADYDKEIVLENVKLSKQKQLAVDKNRIANKSFREDARSENAVAELATQILAQNKEFGKELSKLKFKKQSHVKGGTGVIQITDVHANELIDLPHNRYDFNVMAKRLKAHVTESLAYFEFRGVSKVLMLFTGDLINSDRRLDEIISASTNRAKATVLTIHILKQAICQVREKYPVDIISVLGNESRVNKEMTFSNEALSDNYDFTIVAQLKQIFEFAKIKNVNFKGYDKVWEVIDFGQQKWGVSHNLSGSVDSQKGAQSHIGMFSLQGHKIDYLVGGHIHALNLTEISSRSSSLCGDNAYANNALGLTGRATHNCYVVNGKKRYTQVNDVQDVEGVEGYEIVSQLEAYNAKSASKLKEPKLIMQIVI